MSALAMFAQDMGYEVYGTNVDSKGMVDLLKRRRIKVFIGHSEKNWLDPDLLVVSSAIPKDNPEILRAKSEGVPVVRRLDFLSELSKDMKKIGITGTDGKTTTTAMISQIFDHAETDPTLLLGGIHPKYSNYRRGRGVYLIAEVDESDGSFSDFISDVSVITNIRYDHLNNYGGRVERYLNHFNSFIKNTTDLIVFNNDDPASAEMMGRMRRAVSFGLSKNADYRAINIDPSGLKYRFDLMVRDKTFRNFEIPIPGIHNIYNALSAIAVSMEMGIDVEKIREALMRFRSVDRRFTIRYSDDDRRIYVVDDYAHTPTEITYTLITAQEIFREEKIIAIFQPHRYSRLAIENGRFAISLQLADEIIVTKVYSAYEEEIPGITAYEIHEALKKAGKKSEYVEDFEELGNILNTRVEESTVFLFLGAGDISDFSREFVKKIPNLVGISTHHENFD